MNVFLTTHRPEFKAYVDAICDISSERASSAIPPSYATPITILGRLPGTSREGFPSLPYLIDQARECANLVDIWLDARHQIDSGIEWSDELKRFDSLCEESREKSRQCLTRAEQAERPSDTMSPKWEEMIEHMQRKARLREPNGHGSPRTPNAEFNARTVNSSSSSLVDGYFHRNAAPHRSPASSRLATATSPHSPLSPDEFSSEGLDSETADTPPGSSSGTWDPCVSPNPRENSPPTPSEIDEAEVGIENNSDVVGSSIYSLTPSKSKRDSDATARAAPISPPARSSHSQKKSPQSVYSLRHSSERADISKSLSKATNSKNSGSREGMSPVPQPSRSIYRLTTSSASQQSMDTVNRALRSPTGKEGKGLREGFFGGVFHKKGREKDREETP